MEGHTKCTSQHMHTFTTDVCVRVCVPARVRVCACMCESLRAQVDIKFASAYVLSF